MTDYLRSFKVTLYAKPLRLTVKAKDPDHAARIAFDQLNGFDPETLFEVARIE